MTLKELKAEIERIERRPVADGCEVRVRLVDYTDDMTPIEVGVERIELVAGWRLVIYPDLPSWMVPTEDPGDPEPEPEY